MQTKKCSKCDSDLTLDNFYKLKRGKYGVNSRCKVCSEKIREVYRLNNLDLYAKQARDYRLNNKDHYNEEDNKYRRYYHKTVKGYSSKLFSGAKGRAKKKNMEFNLTSEWVFNRLQPLICEVTGIILSIAPGVNVKTQPLQPTLDRIDSSKGYTMDNTRVTCWWYNAMKQDWTDEQILPLIREFYNKKLKNE